VHTLGDATRALRRVVAVERRTLAKVDSGESTRLRTSLAAAQRSLRSIVGADPQQTMSPLRTGVPDARRATGEARAILGSLCS